MWVGFPPATFEVSDHFEVNGSPFEGNLSVAFVGVDWEPMATQNAAGKKVSLTQKNHQGLRHERLPENTDSPSSPNVRAPI
jgi:hypothetical protein